MSVVAVVDTVFSYDRLAWMFQSDVLSMLL
jgi:hypothetical protein